jgi:hypothetical protein
LTAGRDGSEVSDTNTKQEGHAILPHVSFTLLARFTWRLAPVIMKYRMAAGTAAAGTPEEGDVVSVCVLAAAAAAAAVVVVVVVVVVMVVDNKPGEGTEADDPPPSPEASPGEIICLICVA